MSGASNAAWMRLQAMSKYGSQISIPMNFRPSLTAATPVEDGVRVSGQLLYGVAAHAQPRSLDLLLDLPHDLPVHVRRRLTHDLLRRRGIRHRPATSDMVLRRGAGIE